VSATQIVTQAGPKTFVPAELILGGQVVEARAAVNGIGRIGVASAGSIKHLGVALTDAINPEAVVLTSPLVNGRPTLNAAAFPQRVAVAYSGMEVKVTYNAAAAFGDALVVAALGTVTPAGATPVAGTIVGKCTEPLGVLAGAVGLMRTT
jgi:hypothetical protein